MCFITTKYNYTTTSGRGREWMQRERRQRRGEWAVQNRQQKKT